MKFKTTILVPREVEVDFKYYPPSRGARDSLGGKAGAGPPLEPDEEDSIEFLSLIDLKTEEVYDPGDLEEADFNRLVSLAMREVYQRR